MNCTKDYQITIAGTPLTDYLWWKMEEAAGNRVDSIQGRALVPSTGGVGAINRVAGKIDFAVQFSSDIGGTCFLDQNVGEGLSYTNGQGMTLLGWLKHDGISDNFLFFSIFNPVNEYRFSASNLVGGCTISSNAGSALVPTPSSGAWHFFILEYVPGTGIRWEIDRNGVFSTVAALEFGTGANMIVVIEMDNLFGSAIANWEFDEFGLLPLILTPAQKDYIYNGGAGRTSPITLP